MGVRGMGTKQDMQHLRRLKGGNLMVSVAVPRKLQETFGASKLTQPLGTDSLREASRRKLPIVAAFKDRIEAARRGGEAPEGNRAIAMRQALALASDEAEDGDDSPRDFVLADIVAEAEAVLGFPIGTSATGSYVYDPEREKRADAFHAIAVGKVTPLKLPREDFAAESKRWAGKTWGQFDTTLNKLAEWLRKHRHQVTVEAVTRQRAAAFKADMLKAGRKGQTVNARLSTLRGYWKWLMTAGLAHENPWEGQSVVKGRRTSEDGNRAFTDDEMLRLLSGTPKGRGAYLADLMRIAALTGARMDDILDLRVCDCANGIFALPRQKREKTGRLVPIHSAVHPIIARRTHGQPPDAWLFPEVPPLHASASRENRRGNRATKAFHRYRLACGVDDLDPETGKSRAVFHSFRSWFITKAHQALGRGEAFTEATVLDVVGHKHSDVHRAVYRAPSEMDERKRCVEAVNLPAP